MTTRPAPRTPRRAIGALVAAFVLAGCVGYDYKLNERVVFQGPRLFTGYAIADEHLRECVAQAISDGRITRPEALEDLNCSQAGITSLAGLEVFTGLRRLGLDGNAVSDLSPLYALRGLELLQLRGNRIGALDARLCQGAAKQIALAGNGTLACADLAALQACGVRVIDAPAHCTARAP